MESTKVEIGKSCHIIRDVYGGGAHQDVSIDYTEYACDHYSADTETSLDIDKDKAVEIVRFLTECYDL